MPQPKVLVLQILIGVGKVLTGYSPNTNVVLRDYFCPSIKRWAESCGYTYTLVTQPIASEYVKYFRNEKAFYNFQRFFHFKYAESLHAYDYVAYFDADIYAPAAAHGRPLPLKRGLSARIIPNPTPRIWVHIDKSFDADKLKTTPYVNGGVMLLDTPTARRLGSQIIERLTTRPQRTDRNQCFIWEYISQNLEGFNALDRVWNLHDNQIDKAIEDGEDNHCFIHCKANHLLKKQVAAYLNIPAALTSQLRKKPNATA